MASTAARSPAESGTTGATFSYAQAAKGRASSTTASAVQSSQGTSGTSTPKDFAAGNVLLNGSVNSTGDKSNGDDLVRESLKSGNIDSENVSKPSGSTISKSLPSSPSYGATSISTLPKEDENSSVNNLSSDSPWDKRAASDAADKAADTSERKKGKKSKKDKTQDKDADKDKEEVKQEVFVPAPPPTVNFWQQRKEAAEAKVKPNTQSVEPPQAVMTESTPSGNDAATAARLPESKKKSKVIGSEEVDKSAPSTQNGAVKEQSNPNKAQKKGSEASNKAKDEPNHKRNGPRGSRGSDKEEKTALSQPPPPVADAVSWPTPETALEEEKRKAQEKMNLEKVEKEEKEDASSNKPRQKKEWVNLPYIPTVTFNTPLPSRGGRGRTSNRGGRESGGRGGHAPSGSVSGDKTGSTSAGNNPNTEGRERGRENASSTRAASLPPNTSKRTAGDASFNSRDQRKTSATSTFEKPKNEGSGPAIKNDQSSAGHSRRMSTAQIESGATASAETRTESVDAGRSNILDESSATFNDQVDPRSAAPERRSDGNIRLGEFPKDINSNQPRERGESRGDRGRGGYRGRGGNSNFQNGQQHTQQQSFVNGHTSHPSNGFGLRQNAGPYSPPLQQPQYPSPFSPQATRGGRNGPARAQSIPNGNPMYGRYPPQVSGPPQMAPIQTGGPMFEYPGMQSMSAIPFNPYIEQYSMLAMVTMQLEYYFSIDNLCKDVYLRKHMDGQGFVFLKFIANFKRIQQLTQDLDMLRFACQESEIIEIVIGDDGLDRARRVDGWEKWVFPVEERDESVRNPGPDRVYRQVGFQRAQQMAPRMMAPGQPMMSPPPFSPNGTEQNFRLYGPGPVMMNGSESGYVQHNESPLSAAVPEFTPVPDPIPSEYHDVETKFTDEEVEKLNLVYTQKAREEVKANPPSYSASSRTFSNGSIDGRSINEELQEMDKRQSRTLTNGGSHTPEFSPDSSRRSRSPFALSPTNIMFGSAPPIMWVKGQKDQAPAPESNKEESYIVVRARALRHRESAPIGETDDDMKILFEFWCHFLVRNFNPHMYEEFRSYAFDDMNQRQATFGVINLITFYDEVLNSKKRTIPEIFAKHYIELVKGEDPSGPRPGFAKLRAAWRNGALDMKSRKKIDGFVDPTLREELEK